MSSRAATFLGQNEVLNALAISYSIAEAGAESLTVITAYSDEADSITRVSHCKRLLRWTTWLCVNVTV